MRTGRVVLSAAGLVAASWAVSAESSVPVALLAGLVYGCAYVLWFAHLSDAPDWFGRGYSGWETFERTLRPVWPIVVMAVLGNLILSLGAVPWPFLAYFVTCVSAVAVRLLPRSRSLDKLIGRLYVRWHLPSEINDRDVLQARARNTRNADVLVAILDHGVIVDERNDSGETLLHEALRRRKTPTLVGLLLNRGADLDVSDDMGKTPLDLVAAHPNPEMINLLLDRDSDIRKPPRLAQALLDRAVMWNENPNVLAVLLDRGADVTARGEGGWSPLHGAALTNRNPRIISSLLNRGAAINARTARGATPLHCAVENNENPSVATVLLDRGADPTSRDADGCAAGDLAAKNPYVLETEVLQRLQEAAARGIGPNGAEPND